VRFFYWADFATWRALSLSPLFSLFSVLALLSLSLSLSREREADQRVARAGEHSGNFI
jgi:hypothetical protein